MQIVKDTYFKYSETQTPLLSGINLSKYATQSKDGCENWNLITNTQFIGCSFHPNCDVFRFVNCGFHDCDGVRWLNLEECEVID